MKILTFLLLCLCIQCEKKIHKDCLIQFKNSEQKMVEKIITNITYHKKNKVIDVSILNNNDKIIKFISPVVIFGLNKENIIEKENHSTVIKSYVNSLNAYKINSIIIDIKKNKKSIFTDTTMQRYEKDLLINLAPGETFVKEFYIDCKNSDEGNYKIYILQKQDSKNNQMINIYYPDNASIILKK